MNKKLNKKKHDWELIHAYTWVEPRYAIFRCKKCGKIVESESDLSDKEE